MITELERNMTPWVLRQVEFEAQAVGARVDGSASQPHLSSQMAASHLQVLH